ncbi:MAG: hypothetical protein AUG51_19385 [Acidobacteria bacterium 13_1_20CM_3_53_8]|nr:MAG: hypothetical protein AUG51_19385 [Acidobacteria bacterium 13_1_20CM_3_53_8]
MKMKARILFIIALLSFLFIGWTYQSAQRTQWEYKFEYAPSERKANELGAQGWELVAIQSTGSGMGNNVPNYVFKRAKQ